MTEQRKPSHWMIVIDLSAVLASVTTAVFNVVSVWMLTHSRQPLQGHGGDSWLVWVLLVPPAVFAGLWLWQKRKG